MISRKNIAHIYQNDNFWWIRKDHGIASTLGKHTSILDIINPNDMDGNISDEYWMLNRLDTVTAGRIWGARSAYIYDKYKLLQSQGKVIKYYIADIYGHIQPHHIVCDYPIGHHIHLQDRMSVIKTDSMTYKIRGNPQSATTIIDLLYYDPQKNISTVYIQIFKGVRHQIRAHLRSLGYSIVGESIYTNSILKKQNHNTNKINLWSIGIDILGDI